MSDEINIERNETTMSQQVDVLITLDTDVDIDTSILEDFIEWQVSNIDLEIAQVLEVTLKEEAEIYGHCESKSKYLKTLKQIASQPLWGETENVDIQTAREADEWDEEEHCYTPSCVTESEQFEAIVKLAREAIASVVLRG